jgi:putative transposase
MNTQTYPTDLTDRKWDYIKDMIPAAKAGGRPRNLDMRQVLNAILYILVSGAQWHMLPKDYPKWKSVHHYFRLWRDDGAWQHIHATLRAQVRRRAGRHKHSTAGCLDRQSVKSTSVRGCVATQRQTGQGTCWIDTASWQTSYRILEHSSAAVL